MIDDYAFWRDALAGNFGSIHDGHPQPGFYRTKSKGNGWDKAVAIWKESDGKSVAMKGGESADASDIWTWCCRYPITEELYRSVSEGAPWPDVVLSNNPPADEVTRDEIDSAIKSALDDLRNQIMTQEDCDRIANHKRRIGDLFKATDKQREDKKRPHMDAAKMVDGQFKPMLAGLAEASKKLTDHITSWMLAEERRRREEALAEMARRKAAEDAAIAANQPPPAPAPLTEVERPKAGTQGRAVSLRPRRYAKITNYDEALKHFAQSPEVKAAVEMLADRAARANIPIPGIEIREERTAV